MIRFSNQICVLGLLVIVSLYPGADSAIPVPGLDVPALTRDASLIVVGQVISIQEVERGRYEIRGIVMSARRMKAFFRVDRVLKGEAGAELSFGFFLTDQFAGYAGVAADQSGL